MIKLGSNNIGKIYLGHTEISMAYLGNVKFFETGSSPTPPTPILPDGYTQLSYIENALERVAYINTQVLVSNTLVIECKMRSYDQISGNVGQYGCLFGARKAAGTADVQVTTFINNQAWGGTLRNGNSNANQYDAHLDIDNDNVISLSSTSYSCNGTMYNYSRANIDSTNAREIYIFALSNNNNATQNGHGRLYYFKMWDDGVLVRNFVPCINPNNVYGLYDTVSETFFGSGNSTAFTGQ